MDVFEFRGKLVSDYAVFTRSFTRIHAKDIQAFVDEAYDSGRYWPDPLVLAAWGRHENGTLN